MELALNIFWLILALGGLFYWMSRKPKYSSGHTRSMAWRRGLVSLCCVLVVLFPVISMTDDLHDEVAVLEKSKSSQMGLRNDDRPGSSFVRLHTPLHGLPPLKHFPSRWQPVGWVVFPDHLVAQGYFARVSLGRAPPFPQLRRENAAEGRVGSAEPQV
jgi:hypothetical protein